MRIWPPLPSTQRLFRVHRNASSRNPKTGKPKPKTFYRRKTELGLSVFLSKEAALLAGLDVAGLCTFTVEQIYNCPQGLVLVQESVDHAEIRAVPLIADDSPEDTQRALDIADYLGTVAEDVPI